MPDINVIIEPQITEVVLAPQEAINVGVTPVMQEVVLGETAPVEVTVVPQVVEVVVTQTQPVEVVLNVGPKGADATVTKENVEAVLTGEISTHSHAGGGFSPEADISPVDTDYVVSMRDTAAKKTLWSVVKTWLADTFISKTSPSEGQTITGGPLTVAGIIETTSGGYKFPDGTTQTTAAEGTMVLTTNYDEVSATLAYVGEAVPGSLTSAASWRIKKLDFSNDDVVTTWAGGTALFDKVWNDRLTLEYS